MRLPIEMLSFDRRVLPSTRGVACTNEAPQQESQKRRLDTAAGDRAQQPAQVVAGGAQHGVQRVTHGARQPAAIHAVVRLRMADGRLQLLSDA